MRLIIINFLKKHAVILELFWKICRGIFNTIGFLVPTNSHKLIFSAFCGRKFDDIPRAIYE